VRPLRLTKAVRRIGRSAGFVDACRVSDRVGSMRSLLVGLIMTRANDAPRLTCPSNDPATAVAPRWLDVEVISCNGHAERPVAGVADGLFGSGDDAMKGVAPGMS